MHRATVPPFPSPVCLHPLRLAYELTLAVQQHWSCPAVAFSASWMRCFSNGLLQIPSHLSKDMRFLNLFFFINVLHHVAKLIFTGVRLHWSRFRLMFFAVFFVADSFRKSLQFNFFFFFFSAEIIDKLTLTFNRTRQAVITKELIEIISGAAAL